MQELKQTLEDIGLTKGEIKAYLALLELGPSRHSDIYKKADISASKLKPILQKLIEKGLVNYFLKDKTTFYEASKPNKILDYLERRELKFKQEKELVKKILPNLNLLQKEKVPVTESKIYEGLEGLKTVRERNLEKMKSGDIIYYFGNPASGYETLTGYWDFFNKKREKKKVWAYIAYNPDAKGFAKKRGKEPYTKVRYLPTKQKSHAWIEIYGNTLVIACRHKKPMAVVIENELYAESFKTYFDLLWKISKV